LGIGISLSISHQLTVGINDDPSLQVEC